MAIIGIDLGTSNSAAAVLRGGRPVIIPSAEGISLGGKAFPSYVAILADGQMIVGEPARRQATLNPEGTASAFKRRMGRREKIRLRDQEVSPEQLSAFLLQKIKGDSEAVLGERVERAVVTVPAYFDDNQRSATKDACRIAGLEVVRLVNEPTAASLAYGLVRLEQELRIAVIDLGGGTLDVTIMEFGKGVFEVKATSGDTQLGGTDMDRCLVTFLIERFRLETGMDVGSDLKAQARIREAAETAKIELTTSPSTHISLPYLSVRCGRRTAASGARLNPHRTRTIGQTRYRSMPWARRASLEGCGHFIPRYRSSRFRWGANAHASRASLFRRFFWPESGTGCRSDGMCRCGSGDPSRRACR